MNTTLYLLLAAVALGGCGTSSTPVDGGADTSVGDAEGQDARDAMAEGGADAAVGEDAGAGDSGMDVGIDAGLADASVDALPDAEQDAGTPCTASSCFDFFCGRSECGYSCGQCERDTYCALNGQCAGGVPPGDLCIDAWSQGVVEGGSGFRACPTAGEVQRCMCSGGGADAWFGCDDCRVLNDVADVGTPCRTDGECAGASCTSGIGLCGATCDASNTDCPGSTVCAIPGDVAGVCLEPCAACGSAECGHGRECVPHWDMGFVCVGAGNRLFGVCSE